MSDQRGSRSEDDGAEQAASEGSDVSEHPPFPLAVEVMEALQTLWSAGHGAYVVGGGVRDALLGLPVTDWDIATDARPERLLEIFPGSTYENRFGTVLARGLEITTFRRDQHYGDHRRPDAVTFSADVFEDLARRDLTINAIAWGRRSLDAAARLVDPADGQGDLQAGLVRAVGDPDRRFDEDALRLLRAARIAARLDFRIEPGTLQAMRRHAGDVAWVSEERVAGELRRMLADGRPSRSLRLLDETGILALVLPELATLPQAVLTRSLDAVDLAAEAQPDGERLALASLFGALGPAALQAVLARMRIGSREAEAVSRLTVAAREPYAADWSDAAVRRYMAGLPAELLDDLLELRRVGAACTHEPGAIAREAELRRRMQGERAAASPLSLAELAIDGHDLCQTLGLAEGPIIGRLLERLLADVLEEPALNVPTLLLARASRVLDELSPGETAGHGSTQPLIR